MGCGSSGGLSSSKSPSYESRIPPPPEYVNTNVSQFKIGNYIQCGALGKVYSATQISDNKIVAMKCFGYTQRTPDVIEIEKEIRIMSHLKGIQGIVQLIGVCMDSTEGIVSGKHWKISLPIIVMELLNGGEVFERILKQQKATEKQLASIFGGIIKTLNDIHTRGYVHRDLKLENLMYISNDIDAEVKVIDFGMMVELPPGRRKFMGADCDGTPGYVAPESILHFEYSAKTDIWQAGCCLYAMLSGNMAFDPENLDQTTHDTYKPMVGSAWSKISPEAKDLVAHILEKDPTKRYGSAEILAHKWITHENYEISDANLDPSYFARIKVLALRKKLKVFFLEQNIFEQNNRRRQSLVSALPFLYPTENGGGEGGGDLDVPTATTSSEELREKGLANFHKRLRRLKTLVISSVYSMAAHHNESDTDLSEDEDEVEAGLHCHGSAGKETGTEIGATGEGKSATAYSSHSATPTNQSGGDDETKRTFSKLLSSHVIDYECFVELLRSANLPELANRQVFDIFDEAKSGDVDIKEFLFAMLAFRPARKSTLATGTKKKRNSGNQKTSVSVVTATENAVGEESKAVAESPRGGEGGGPQSVMRVASEDDMITEQARLYFDMFDIRETGYIELDELKQIVGCLMIDDISQSTDSPQSFGGMTNSIEELFRAMDVKKTGIIDFDEFRLFYHTVLYQATAVGIKNEHFGDIVSMDKFNSGESESRPPLDSSPLPPPPVRVASQGEPPDQTTPVGKIKKLSELLRFLAHATSVSSLAANGGASSPTNEKRDADGGGSGDGHGHDGEKEEPVPVDFKDVADTYGITAEHVVHDYI